MKNLREAFNAHYRQQSLSEKQLKDLMALQQHSESADVVSDEKNHRLSFTGNNIRYFLAIAASFVVISLTGLLYNINSVDAREKVALEIAYNHSKRMALEIASSNLNDVGAHLSELDFTLVDSVRTDESEWNLLGGRYCSIQGKLAAQLRIKQTTNDSYHTYYQAIIPDDFELGGSTYSTWVEGTYIELWVEGGLLLGLAGEGPTG
ncbi:MAG: hypothetical protein QGH99_08550 [Pseudomonadales bacterium]|jgi:hypothetical protein|nr:hypothetical protein [Gammaproteobacteria bacterium]MDP6027906.1 hypothetical protein [Pseudomonadales bacterium]MDP6316135.1 hypothetical protein [Pseudomonadales bacterium]MDP7315605.1 hypothetical protein [Pseudomonadales bacterium]MDP7577000.1 hypothetical protein [Pseudomonadales bacterium]|tara:strand:- start:16377 stop:16994 length:618 start_codon:yes stop_codon:yes gene_type:complete